ncbi:MAG TPA: hypothetical protein VD948_03635 [Rhodothermales bacterium]|nr:hypothetical protein [Rhodothermales bacterium]
MTNDRCPACGATSPTTEEVEALYAEIERLRRAAPPPASEVRPEGAWTAEERRNLEAALELGRRECVIASGHTPPQAPSPARPGAPHRECLEAAARVCENTRDIIGGGAFAARIRSLPAAPAPEVRDVLEDDGLLSAAEKAIEMLRCSDEAGPGGAIKCELCDYEGPAAVLACACYDENAMYCRPDARGAGCFNGAQVCPVCEDCAMPKDRAAVLMALEAALAALRARRDRGGPTEGGR